MAFEELEKCSQRSRFKRDKIYLGHRTGRIARALLLEYYDEEPRSVVFLYDRDTQRIGLRFDKGYPSQHPNGYRVSSIPTGKSLKTAKRSRVWRYFNSRHLGGRGGLPKFKGKEYDWTFEDGMFVIELKLKTEEERNGQRNGG